MAHDDVRAVNGVYELFSGNRQLTIGGDAIVFTEADAEALRDALYDETSFGEKYVFNAANFAILSRVSAKLNRHNPLPTAITKGRIFESYAVVDAAGGLTEFGNLERVPEEVVVPAAPVARDEQGRFQNQLVNEYLSMLDNPSISSSEITKRLNNDRAFRAAVEAYKKTEGQPQQPVQSYDEKLRADEELSEARDFIAAYYREPSPRFLSGFISIGGFKYTKEQFNAEMEKAARLGLGR